MEASTNPVVQVVVYAVTELRFLETGGAHSLVGGCVVCWCI